MKASKFERVDAFDFGRCLRELREERLVEEKIREIDGVKRTSTAIIIE